MKIAALILVALCPIAALAQTTPPSSASVTKLVRLHHARPGDVRGLIGGIVNSWANGQMNAIVLNGPPKRVSEAERIIQQLDVAAPPKPAPRNVELTVYILGATNKSAAQSAAMPQRLQPVVAQLKAIFPYTSYALLDSMLMRSREGGKASNTGMLRSFPSEPNPAEANTYGIDYQISSPETSASRTVHFQQFNFYGREWVGSSQSTTQIPVGFKTSLDLPEGKQVVVGKTNIDGGHAALFVVLSAKIE